MRRWTTAAALAAAALLASGCFSTMKAPGAPVEELAGAARFSQERWDAFLKAHVDDQGRVDYASVAADPADLDSYVGLVAAAGPETRPELFPTREDRLAYYLNAYNALVVWQVVRRWPIESVARHKARFFYFTRLPLDGGGISLYDLENAVIRAGFGEPRVHFALNCASASCPRLPREAFQGDRLEEQLERETQRFLHEPRNVRLEDGKVVLSEIFDWFQEDFEPSPLAWIRAKAPDLGLPADAKVRIVPWDWTLNAQPGSAPRVDEED